MNQKPDNITFCQINLVQDTHIFTTVKLNYNQPAAMGVPVAFSPNKMVIFQPGAHTRTHMIFIILEPEEYFFGMLLNDNHEMIDALCADGALYFTKDMQEPISLFFEEERAIAKEMVKRGLKI